MWNNRAHSLSFMPQFPLQKPTPLENFCTPHRPFVPNLPIRKVYPSPSFSQFRLKGTSYMQAFQWIFCTCVINFSSKRFFKSGAGDLLPALRFLGGLHNFCNYIVRSKLVGQYPMKSLLSDIVQDDGWQLYLVTD